MRHRGAKPLVHNHTMCCSYIELERGRAGVGCLILKPSYFHSPSSGLELGALSNQDGVYRTPRVHAQWPGPESSPIAGQRWQDRSSQTHCQQHAALRGPGPRGEGTGVHMRTLRAEASAGLKALGFTL